jgi:hypothetical protein
MWRGTQEPPQRWKRPVQSPLIGANIAHRAAIEQRPIATLGDEGNASLGEIVRVLAGHEPGRRC